MGFLLAAWKLIGVRGAIAIGLGLALLVTGLRLNHAKADQLDHRSCVHGQPCKPIKWEAEAKANEKEIADLGGKLSACTVSNSRLSTALTEQNASIEALRAQGAASTAAADQAAAQARRFSEATQRRAQAVLATKPGDDRCRSADELILGAVS